MYFDIECIHIPYDSKLEQKWRERDPSVVPDYVLCWNGPGVKHSYGFGEWFASNFFQRQGYKVINNEYNLVSKTSKFQSNNNLISSIIGKEKIELFGERAREFISTGVNIVTNLDLFIYNNHDCFFVEVKKGKDTLNKRQVRFMYLAEFYLNVKSKLIYLDENLNVVKTETLRLDVDLWSI